MPLNSPIQKQYFSISEVAQMFGVNASLLRFWEKEFKQIQPKTNARGKRSYNRKDIEIIKSIYVLVKEQGFTLEGAKKALSARKGASAEAGAVAKKVAKETSVFAKKSTPSLNEKSRKEVVDRLKMIRAQLLAIRDEI
ncbi:MAG: transcriptional regulator [Crocinitomicaceae bacterium]|nr:transcriptional regulator [Crocinitomicaceae bacterium]